MSDLQETEQGPSNPLGEVPVVFVFLALAGLVFYETNTSFVEQGAASGGAMFNAALYPELLAWALVGLSALRLASIAKAVSQGGHTSSAPGGESRQSLFKALIWLGFLVVYLMCLKPLGYHLVTPAFMFACFFLLGSRNILLAAALAVATSLTMSFVFEVLLNVILPVGIFGIGF
ncbi:MAG: tripartite tricarboxylate transporter TctB family protein [Paracoccaceae bacterium]